MNPPFEVDRFRLGKLPEKATTYKNHFVDKKGKYKNESVDRYHGQFAQPTKGYVDYTADTDWCGSFGRQQKPLHEPRKQFAGVPDEVKRFHQKKSKPKFKQIESNGSDLRREKFSMPAVFRYQPSIVHKLLAERVIGVDAQYMAEVLAFKFNHNYKHKLYPISEEDEIEDDAEDAYVKFPQIHAS